MSILVVGSVGLDTIETPYCTRKEVLGGSAAHFALSASKFVKSVHMVAVVGEDFPESYEELLANHGVDLRGFKRMSGRTFRWWGRYRKWDEAETLDTQLNVFEYFDPRLPGEYRGARMLFLANIAPSLQLKVLEQMDGPDLIVMDTMNYWISSAVDEVIEVIRRSHVVLLNEQEAYSLSGKSSLVECGKWVLELGPRVVIIKKGSNGAFMMTDEDDGFSLPGYPFVRVQDPTGAGDSFAGGFMGFLDSCGDEEGVEQLRRAVVYGCIMGSINVEAVGVEAVVGAGRKKIEERYRRYRALVAF